jgi:hypothetical protein
MEEKMLRKFSYLVALAALGAPAAAQGQLPPHQPGTICLTNYGWCWLPRPFPSGGQCYCATPQGPIYGRVV